MYAKLSSYLANVLGSRINRVRPRNPYALGTQTRGESVRLCAKV
jgi:hypothetical protein